MDGFGNDVKVGYFEPSAFKSGPRSGWKPGDVLNYKNGEYRFKLVAYLRPHPTRDGEFWQSINLHSFSGSGHHGRLVCA